MRPDACGVGDDGPRPAPPAVRRIVPIELPQHETAPGGAFDYVAHGPMIGGFAAVTPPIRSGTASPA
jgi:hypothetical protein